MPLSAMRYALLSAVTECYRCLQETPVVAIALPPETRIEEDQQPHGWLSAVEVEELPAAVAVQLGHLPGGANYKVDFSATAGISYVINHCGRCGAKLGDHFMHSEPDGPFFGDVTENLQVRFVGETIELEAGYAEGSLGVWLEERLNRKDLSK